MLVRFSASIWALSIGDLVNVTDVSGLTVSGGTVNLTNAGGLASGTYKLLDYTGTLGGDFNNLVLGTSQPVSRLRW